MKSGGPWNLRGLRPDARAAARDAARRSGMSVGEWLNTVISPAEERETESRRPAHLDRGEAGREPQRHRKQPQRQAHPGEREPDHDQEREWQRHSGRRGPARGEGRGSFEEQRESGGRGVSDEGVNFQPDRQTSQRRPSETRKEHSTKSFGPERGQDREDYYDRSTSPRQRARDDSRRFDAREDRHDQERNQPHAAPSPDRANRWAEESRAGERDEARERHRDPSHRPDPAQRRAREEGWRESSHGGKSQRYQEPPTSLGAGDDNASWQEESWRGKSGPGESWEDFRNDKRQREKKRILSNREPDEDRFEYRTNPESDRYPEPDRSSPKLALKRDQREYSSQNFSEEETEGYQGESSPYESETADTERSNFDHEPGHEPRGWQSLEPEEPFETIRGAGRLISERGDVTPDQYGSQPDYRRAAEQNDEERSSARRAKVGRGSRGRRDELMQLRAGGSRSRADDSENAPHEHTHFDNREEHYQRRDTKRQWPPSSDDERWPAEMDTFRGDNTGLGGPYRDLGAAVRTPSPQGRERHRDVIGSDVSARDAAVDKAIAEITIRQRALEEAAAAEMAARSRRAETLAAQQQTQGRVSVEEFSVSETHYAASDVAASVSPPPAETPARWTPSPAPRLSTEIKQDRNAAASHRVDAPASYKMAEPAPKAPDHGLVAEITARMRALESTVAADRSTYQSAAERQTRAGAPSSQRSLVDDVADDILAEKFERRDRGDGTFSREPESSDLSNHRSSRAVDGSRKNEPGPVSEIALLEGQLRQLTARVDALRPPADLKTPIDGLRRELSEMSRAFTEALPRRALESLEFEIKKLGRRLDESRQNGRDLAALADIERGLTEVREGLRGLAPAEDLAGFGDAMTALTQKVDALAANNDSAAIDQLQTMIGDLRLAVSRVASDDALGAVAEEVRLLSGRIDDLAKDGPVALQQIHVAIGDLREAVSGVASDDALSGVADEVRLLSAKVDSLGDLVKGDPAALEQLHIAISNLRHAVSRVASDDAVSRLGEEVRLLSARMDDLAHNAADNRTLLQIESRMDALTAAIHASTKNGQAVPRELEKLLSALVDKLELSQLTQTDHTALSHLEDRIAMLMQRLDASDARLGLLEGVERGLADLLVYIEQLRAGGGSVLPSPSTVFPPNAIEDQFAEIKHTERRTQDSIEAVQGTVDHVVDRLARIESDIRARGTWSDSADSAGSQEPELAPSLSPADEPDTFLLQASTDMGHAAEIEPAANRRDSARAPIDPNLPPDHPLEPGSAPGRAGRAITPAERLAALESIVPVKSPVVSDPPGGKADFIAAARRAAQAASGSPNDKSSAISGVVAPSRSKKLSERLRTLFVAAAVVAIVVGGFRVVSQMFDHGGPPAQEPAAPPHVTTEPSPGSPLQLTPSEPSKQPATPSGRSSDANTTNMSKTVAAPALGSDSEQHPAAAQAPSSTPAVGAARQSLLDAPGNFAVNSGTLPDISDSAAKNASTNLLSPDVTGSLPPSSAGNAAPLSADKLPVVVGGPGLRAAALAGDPAAAYEVGVRFAEGRNVPQNNEDAAHWLDIAAKKGFVPAQFRLGTLYEKGVGVKKDLPEAISLYRAAADKGHGKAMHNLAVLYAEGGSGSPDYRTAAQWFRKAAELGVTDSQYNLAILYARGVGVEQSFTESYKWFFLAAKQGDKDAAQKRDDVAGRLDQQTLAAAKSAAEQWTAQPQPAEAVSVKASDAWDPPAKNTSALKPKSHSAAKVPPPDVMKVD